GENDVDPVTPGLQDGPLTGGALQTCEVDGIYDLSGNLKEWVDEATARLTPHLTDSLRERCTPLAVAAAEDTARRSIAALRGALDAHTARLALSLADGFGGAMEMLRSLDFDDRPRGALDAAELARFFGDHDLARDLLLFAASEPCLAVRRWRAGQG
ncbi:MAG: hypothetical protein KC620_04405, partial [Myxococcales bacterium]|nr:hypothetical protein [Myxococcales bacterium]